MYNLHSQSKAFAQSKKINKNNNGKENVAPINKNLIENRKNMLSVTFDSEATSLGKFTNDSPSTYNKEKSNSFDELLTLLVTPDNESTKQNYQESPSIKLSKNNNSLRTTNKAGPTFRSQSFELMFNSLLSPTNDISNKSNFSSQSDGDKSKDMTFEEMMNKIFTPDLGSPDRRKESRFKFQYSTQSYVNEKRKRKNNPQSVPQQQNKRNTPNSETAIERASQQSVSTSHDADISFQQLLSQVLSQDLKSQEEKLDFAKENTHLQNKNGMQEKPEPSTQSTNLSQRNSQEQHKRGFNSTKIYQSFQSGLDTDDINFDQILSQELTPNRESQKERTENSCREISTQTSFDEFSMPMSSSALLNRLENDYANFHSQNGSNTQDFNKNLNYTTAADSCDEGSSEAETNERCRKKQPKNGQHILEILSRDFTALPDGRKVFNNISQVGTDKWLQSAFNVARKRTRNKKKKFEIVEIMEEQNTSSLYVDYVTKVGVRRYLQENTKVCEINRTDARTTTEYDINETNASYFWSKPSNELSPCSEAELKLRQEIDKLCNDNDLVYTDFILQKIDKTKICIKIHNIFAKLFDAFQSNRIPKLVLKRSRDKRGCTFVNERLQYRAGKEAPLKKICFKNKSMQFSSCRLLYIMGRIYSLLQNKTKLTKREIFYQIKHIVKRQSCVDDAIEEATRLLGVGFWHLNIQSQSGLVYGNLKLYWNSSETTNCNAPGTLIPCDLEDLVKAETNAFFILVVEKESIFCKLLAEDIPNKLARPFIMVTGKGVPSINTRLFLNKISKLMALPVFILVDGDVYGIRIMLSYRFGTIKNCHLSDDLAVPNARWLGVFPSEIAVYGMKSQELTKRDKNNIKSLLEFPYMEEYPQIAAELELLLSLNKKASIEGLIKNDTFLSESYLPMKFFNQNFM